MTSSLLHIRPAARFLPALLAALVLVFALPALARPDRTSLYGSYLAGRFATAVNDDVLAAKFYRDALRQDPDNTVILERAFLLHLATGDIEAAGELARRLVKLDTGHSVARFVLGAQALRARQFASALKHFQATKGSGPVIEITRAMASAWAQQGLGRHKEALAALDVLPEAGWYKVYRTYNGAAIAELSGDAKGAAELFAEAYKLDEESLRISEAYARFLARRGETARARAVLDAYDKVAEDHPYIVALRKEIGAGRVPEPAITSPAAGAAEGLHQIGALLAREGAEDQATAYFQLALYLDPGATLPLLSLADIYEQRKDHARAAAVYARIADDSPMSPYAVMQRARNLDAMDETEQARTLLDGLIAREPGNVEAIKTLADILRGREKFAEAAVLYSRAIGAVGRIEEQHWTLLYYRGICYERAKRWPLAEADLKAALELVPDQPFVLNYLGYSWIDQGVNLDRALEMIRKAVELRPDDGYIVDSLGWAHYRLGDFAKAAEELERAVELKPEDPIINDHLGDAYWRAGRRLEAGFQWRHALGLDPEPEARVKIEAKLKDGLPPREETKLVVAQGGEGAAETLPGRVSTEPEDGEEGDPAREAQPTEVDKPAEEMKPADEVKPAEVDKPAEEMKPADEVKPAEGDKPAKEMTPAEDAGRRHVVEPGDTLWFLSRKYLGEGADWRRLFEVNRDRLRDADRIYPGQELVIPPAE